MTREEANNKLSIYVHVGTLSMTERHGYKIEWFKVGWGGSVAWPWRR